MRSSLLALAVAASLAAAPSPAQVWTPRAAGDSSTLRPEIRLDYLGGRTPALHGGVGLSARAGTYVRVGGNVGAGTDGAHADVDARFLLDPFRQSRVGISLGGGVSARYQHDRVRAFALLFADVESGRRPGWRPFLRAGLGGGARVAIGLRRAGIRGR